MAVLSSLLCLHLLQIVCSWHVPHPPLGKNALKGIVKPILITTALIGLPRASRANGGFNVREEIAKGAAAVPGFGQTDVYFPSEFEGDWNCRLEVSDIIDNSPLASERLREVIPLVRSFAINRPIMYTRRFVSSSGKVVEDRAFSTKQLTNVLTGSTDAQVSWEMSNPNTLTYSTRADGGSITENKVTKRSMEALGEGQVGFSEYSRLAEVAGASGIQAAVPNVFGKRVMTRLKVLSPERIRGVQRTYYYPADYTELGGGLPEPMIVVKSRFTMTRKGAQGNSEQ